MLARRVVFAGVSVLVVGCYHGGSEVTESTGAVETASEAATAASAATAGSATGETGGPTSSGEASTGAAPTSTGWPGTTTTTGPDEMSSGTDPVDSGTASEATSEATTGAPVDPVAEVCGRWTADRADMSEGTWDGDVAGCLAGDTGAPGRDNALKLVNLYRWLAGLPPVGHDAGLDAKAQQCALMMHANGQLSHEPPMKWKCYTADGAQAAMNSNISSTPGVVAVDLYMVDPGNATTFGHRRWILSNGLGPIGLGSTAVNSCMWVIGGQGGGSATWTAWPPAGVVPIDAIHVPEVPWSDVDQTGWTIQSDALDLGAAQVSITEGGVDKPVQLTTLMGGFGSASAIAMTPQGWVSEAGKTYTVQVNGVPQPFSYEVQVVACP
ncbi:CAP domain-containing protein [Nannocystis punicea]|uniref:CAP domain-containing protein n=1 Tax=Nannocystis punicea TaxID=2995304 RepID=A0ABY7HG14_9BACT|nr:CAP domain-containing protein [Nannocystis poenicansa]WAS97939.1 CAP domain-containing protein [Nannocystis poenicansa]